MKKTISLVLVLALGLAAEVANADFTFGTPTNLGPTFNTSAWDYDPSISADELELYLMSNRPGGVGGLDIWVTTRETTDDPWGAPVNLGPTVNTAYEECCPDISADGLSLFFMSNRPGGSGSHDIWFTTRATIDDEWGMPVNLGPTVNSTSSEGGHISADGLSLFFWSTRPGGFGGEDIWLTKRATTDDDWGIPVNLGPTVNSSYNDPCPDISADGRELFFSSFRPGGSGGNDLWQVSIIPVVDLNGDEIVDLQDLVILVDHWGTDEPLCDIGPIPWGDGIVDVQDLEVLMSYWGQEFLPQIQAYFVEDFAKTYWAFPGVYDWAKAIDTYVGSDYRVADWQDLKKFYDDASPEECKEANTNYYNVQGVKSTVPNQAADDALYAFLDGLHMPDLDNIAYITKDGNQIITDADYEALAEACPWIYKIVKDEAAYRAIRSNGNSELYGYKMLDEIGNAVLTLEAWQSTKAILAVKKGYNPALD